MYLELPVTRPERLRYQCYYTLILSHFIIFFCRIKGLENQILKLQKELRQLELEKEELKEERS